MDLSSHGYSIVMFFNTKCNLKETQKILCILDNFRKRCLKCAYKEATKRKKKCSLNVESIQFKLRTKSRFKNNGVFVITKWWKNICLTGKYPYHFNIFQLYTSGWKNWPLGSNSLRFLLTLKVDERERKKLWFLGSEHE